LHEPTTPAVDDGDEEDKKRHWSKTETRQFIDVLMGPDGYWDKFLKNTNDVFKKVSRQSVMWYEFFLMLPQDSSTALSQPLQCQGIKIQI
jgi:hypothetical protein